MRIRRPARGLLAAATLVAALAVTAGPSTATSDPKVQGDEGTLPNVDSRQGRKAPSQGQLNRVKQGSQARFNRFGSPETLSDPGSYLATGLSDNDVTAAREYLRANAELLGLSQAEVADLELLNRAPIGAGSAVLFRQRFGDIPAGRDGLVALGVVDGKVASLSSSLATDTRLTGAVSISAEDAVRAAADAAGHPAGAIGNARQENGWTVLDVAGYTDPARVRLVGVPTPADGVRQAYEVLLMDLSETLGAMSYVDAATAELLVRDGIVDHAADNPAWKVFPASPPLTYASTDTREVWCWNAGAGCAKAVANPSSPVAWDVDAATNTPTFQTARQQRAGDGEVEHERRQRSRDVNFSSSRDARLRLPVDEPVVHVALQPGLVHLAPAERHRRRAGEPPRDAQPDARLVVRPRLHRDRLQRARRSTSPRAACRTTRSTATPRPAASSAGRQASRRATTPTSSRRPTASCL